MYMRTQFLSPGSTDLKKVSKMYSLPLFSHRCEYTFLIILVKNALNSDSKSKWRNFWKYSFCFQVNYFSKFLHISTPDKCMSKKQWRIDSQNFLAIQGPFRTHTLPSWILDAFWMYIRTQLLSSGSIDFEKVSKMYSLPLSSHRCEYIFLIILVKNALNSDSKSKWTNFWK